MRQERSKINCHPRVDLKSRRQKRLKRCLTFYVYLIPANNENVNSSICQERLVAVKKPELSPLQIFIYLFPLVFAFPRIFFPSPPKSVCWNFGGVVVSIERFLSSAAVKYF